MSKSIHIMALVSPVSATNPSIPQHGMFESLKHTLAAPVVAGASGAWLVKQEFPGASLTLSNSIPIIGGRNISGGTLGFLLGFGASYASSVANTFLAGVDKTSSLAHLPSFVGHVAVSGGFWYGVPQFLGAGFDSQTAMKFAMYGVVSELASAAAYQYFIGPEGVLGINF